jgi:PIN domain nuclease of toxin-antitoxin system
MTQWNVAEAKARFSELVQAMEEELRVVTADPVFEKYGLARTW